MYRAGDYLGFAATVNHAIYEAHNHKSIRYSWHDAPMIYLEGVFARGDRRTADLIAEAYRLGALFDCWLETWNYDRWEQAAANIGMDMDFYALRQREKDEIFPWDFIEIGVRRDFLWNEWEKAHRAVLTPNCREACSGCGAAEYGCGVCLRRDAAERRPEGLQRRDNTDAGRSAQRDGGEPGEAYSTVCGQSTDTDAQTYAHKPENTAGTPADASMEPSESAKAAESRESAEPAESVDSAQDICIRIRMRLAKYGPMKFIGHLELMRFLQKCLRRTDIEVHYSDGITPRMIMSTAMPLGLGLESTGEYVDLELGRPVSTEHALEQLRPLMPEGLEILDFRQVGEAVLEGGGTAKKPEKAMSVVAAAEYEVFFRDGYEPPENWREILEDFVRQEEIPWTKETKKGFRTLDMKPLIYSFSIGKNVIVGAAVSGDISSGEAPADAGGRTRPFGDGTDSIRMCVCSRVGQNLRPEQLIGEAFAGRGLTLPEDALRIRRVDLLAELDANGLCIRQGDRRKGHEEQDAVSGEHRKRSLISLGGIGKVIDTR